MNSEIFLLTIFNSYFIVFENVLDILISLYFRNDLIIACFLTARRKELSFVYTTTYFCYMYTFIFYFLIHGYVLIESYFSVNFESMSSFGIHIYLYYKRHSKISIYWSLPNHALCKINVSLPFEMHVQTSRFRGTHPRPKCSKMYF